MRRISKQLLLATLLTAVPAVASAAPSCTPSDRVAPINYPGAENIHTSNNLLLPAGHIVEAEGNRLIIKGQVLDKQCMPVPEAVVELWQQNPFGKWTRMTGQDLASPKSVFVGTGRTNTDNEGRFTFVTAFPASKSDAAPTINLRVKADGFKTYDSAFYFADDVRNDTDKTYKKLNGARDSLTMNMEMADEDTLTGTLRIVLNGNAPYRTY